MPPPKVIKSILKKNKKSYADNVHPSVPSEVTNDSLDTTIENNGENRKSESTSNISERSTCSKHKKPNGHAKKVHLNNDQNVSINDSRNVSNEDKLKSNFENDIAIKASDHLHTVLVDIH